MLDISSYVSMRNMKLCRYGLLFCVGVLFGSFVMFYKSLDLTATQTDSASQFMWSSREQSYVPLLSHTSIHSASVQYVMILTYMRSGSSFTGDVLQHHPESFYVFEPLISIFHDRSITFINGTNRNLTKNSDIQHAGLQQLHAWYTCDLHNVDVFSFRSIFMSFGIYTSEFYTCIGNRQQLKDIKRCLPQLITACKKSQIRIIKTIRMTMALAKMLIKKYSNFKIIHLLRDPRGILNSRMLTEPKIFTRNRMKPHAKTLCLEMSQDMKVTKSILQQYPQRLTVLQYENLAEHPYSTTAKLYHFLGTVPSLEIYGYVYCITSMGGVAERNYDIKRSNSTSTANKWKRNLTINEIKLIDRACAQELQIIGYSPVSNFSILNNSKTTRINMFS